MNIELLEMKCLKQHQRKNMFDLIKNCLGIGTIKKKGRKSDRKLLNACSHLVSEFN